MFISVGKSAVDLNDLMSIVQRVCLVCVYKKVITVKLDTGRGFIKELMMASFLGEN